MSWSVLAADENHSLTADGTQTPWDPQLCPFLHVHGWKPLSSGHTRVHAVARIKLTGFLQRHMALLPPSLVRKLYVTTKVRY